MAIDYTGMFTGERPNPSAGVAGMPRDLLGQTLQGIDQGEQRSRQALGQMMGKDLRSPADQAREQLSQVDIKSVNTPEGLLKLAQLKQAMGDTGAAMTLASQAQSMRNAQAAAAQEQTRYTAEQGLEERKVAATELKAAGAPEIEQASLVDTKTNKTVAGVELRNGIPYKPGTNTRLTPQELEGKAISKTYVKPPAPLVSTVQTPQQKVEENNLKRQANYVDITAPVAATAVANKRAANDILTEVEKGFGTGKIADFVANQSKNLQGVFQLAGVAYPESFSKKIGDQAVLQILQNEAIIPMMEAQGRGFTDVDLKNQKNVLPGYTQPWQYNEAAATIKLHTAVNQIEENTFANQRSYLSEVTPLDHTTLWDDYLTKLPRSKTVSAEKNGIKYKKMEVLQDNANLSQYWVKDKPTGFTLVTGEGPKDVSWSDIKKTAEAKNKSIREFLAAYENQGLIVKGIY